MNDSAARATGPPRAQQRGSGADQNRGWLSAMGVGWGLTDISSGPTDFSWGVGCRQLGPATVGQAARDIPKRWGGGGSRGVCPTGIPLQGPSSIQRRSGYGRRPPPDSRAGPVPAPTSGPGGVVATAVREGLGALCTEGPFPLGQFGVRSHPQRSNGCTRCFGDCVWGDGGSQSSSPLFTSRSSGRKAKGHRIPISWKATERVQTALTLPVDWP